MNYNTGAILVLSGPSGAGKSTLLKAIIDDIGPCYFSISTTTRQIRDGEVNGIDYHFVTAEEFKKDIEKNLFLEYANVHGNYYGTSLKPVNKALEERKLVIFDIDVQGNEAVINRLGNITTSVFISPPTLSELQHRLESRKTDTQDVIDGRMKMARSEILRIREYDYLIINDKVDEAADLLRMITQSARLKVACEDITTFTKEWEDI